MTQPRTERDASPGLSPLDDAVIAALSHPLRHRILEVLHLGVASTEDIARELSVKVGDVGYHLRRLRKLGLVEIERVEPRRGILKHYYRATARALISDDLMERLPVPLRRRIFGSLIGEVWKDVSDALKTDGFDRADTHVSRSSFELDEEAQEELVALLADTLEQTLLIQARARERGAGTDPDSTLRTKLGILYFLDGE